MKTQFVSNGSPAELPTMCGVFASAGKLPLLASARGAMRTSLGKARSSSISTAKAWPFQCRFQRLMAGSSWKAESEADWRRVAAALRQLHGLTRGWPQRPGWQSSTDLLHTETGTRIDLGAMPPDGVVRCRAAWARLLGRPTCVVHGNPGNSGNIRMTAERIALIDWDEAHVDAPDLDLALPHNAAGLDPQAHDIAAQASAAWEAAVCWKDDYAIKRLAEVRTV